jgi:hypothetical protein
MRRIWYPAGILCLAVAAASAQEYRATVLGTVADKSGATVPGARIVITNTATGIVTKSATNSSGAFVVPFLAPGTYTLEVQHPGFETVRQTGIVLQANQSMRINMELRPGAVTSNVTVTSETPLLNTASANNGQTIDARQLVTLPVHSLNPMEVINLSAGVQYEGGLQYYRAYDNGSIEAYSINGGGESQNNYLLDGFPNSTLTFYETRPQVAFVPPIEGVQETRVETNNYDAQYGGTLGGDVSLVTKSGTNNFHGAAYYAMHRTYLDANTVQNPGGATPFDHVDQYGFELSGPVLIPKVYKGRNRTFFMFSYERYDDSKPQPAEGSVPTVAQRAGDFSTTYNESGNLITIYDPNTTRPNPSFDSSQPVSSTNPQYLRDPFPGKQIPQARMNPVALRILNDIPEPNAPGDSTTHLINWLAPGVTAFDTFNNFLARVDHQFNDRWRTFGRWDHNYRNGATYNEYNWQTPARQYLQNLRQNDGFGLDAVDILNPQSIITIRVGYNRFLYSSNPIVQDLSRLGIPIQNQLQEPGLYPLVNFTNYIGTGINQNDVSPFENYSGQVSMIKNIGRHSLQYGVEYQLQHFADVGRQNGQGAYNFTPGFTQQNPQIPDPASGNSIASFLLGDMASASVNLNAAPYISWHDLGLYLEDNWQATPKLTLNLGLRWDYQAPPEVRHNAQNRGFAFNATSPIQVTGMNLKGGLLFAGVGGQSSGAFAEEYSNLQPRFGFAFRPSANGPLVIRGGVGRSFAPLNYYYGGNIGFAQTTTAQTTTPGFTPLNTLSNPFPNGLVKPTGSSLGLATQAGNGITFTSPNWKLPYVWQFSLGFQYEIRRNMLLDVSYVGSQGRDLAVNKEYDFLTPAQLKLGAAYLNQVVANPFYGVLPANTAIGAQSTTTQAQRLVPYPQFTNVTDTADSIGRSQYNSLQIKAIQRMKYGIEFMAFYTWSKDMDATYFINPQDSQLKNGLDSFDARNRFIVTGTYQLPFGYGREWLNSGIASSLIGGWIASTTGVIQSGTPMPNPSGYYIEGNPCPCGRSLNQWFNTSSSIWVPISPYALSTTPLYNTSIRNPTAPQFDASLFKTFHIRESHELKVRITALNVSNTPFYYPPDNDPTSPTFGQVIIYQMNRPRSVELGARYSF